MIFVIFVLLSGPFYERRPHGPPAVSARREPVLDVTQFTGNCPVIECAEHVVGCLALRPDGKLEANVESLWRFSEDSQIHA